MISFNGWVCPTGMFPNGESWVEICSQLMIHNMNRIEVKFESNDDLINLMFLKRHCDDLCLKCSLVIFNFPYARMDRMNDNYAFSLKYIAEFINNLHFEYVVIAEPHSDVTPALINRIEVRNTIKDYLGVVIDNIDMTEDDFILFPDAGAQKRYGDLNNKMKVVVGNKLRDFKTGKITSYEIIFDRSSDTKGKKLLIIDDLCCGGRTFVEAAKKVRQEMSIDDIYLFVAHCEPAIFDGEILTSDVIKQVFTTDSIIRPLHYKIINVFGINK